jgi:DNA (cytosine-5)-methyltransferase 1
MYRLLDLFSGIGGFSLGLERSGGFKTVAFCEIDATCRRILRQHWPEVKQYDDVRNITRQSLRMDGLSVSCISAGFPCQDASVANIGGKGTDGERTGLFSEVTRIAGDILPDLIILENVPNLLNRGFGDVLGALAKIGYDAEWECISAREMGFNHERDRIFIVAYPSGEGWKRPQPHYGVLSRAKAALSQYRDPSLGEWVGLVPSRAGCGDGDGLSIAMERRRLHAIGNAVVPQIPELIGRAIMEAEAA